MTNRSDLGQKLMLAFRGMDELSAETLDALREYRPAGMTLFRPFNVDTPEQLRRLTAKLQAEAEKLGLPPLLIALDQEGGQLMAIGEATPLPGNMALGAAGSTELARLAGEVLGKELAAMGVNIDYAPCADVNTNPKNPVVGVRSFGEDPQAAARLTAAVVEGIQSQHVAATVKHFPGHGDTATDSHRNMPVVPHSIDTLRKVDFPPFAAAIAADVKLVMTAHLGLPAIDPEKTLPATLSANILQKLLRSELGFGGVIITDAMDMHAIGQGDDLIRAAAQATAAGADLLLGSAERVDQGRLYRGLTQALETHAISDEDCKASIQRVLTLKNWLGQAPAQPGLEVVNCAAHRQIADRIAESSITLVRDEQHWLPLHLNAEQKIAVVLPHPQDLTPADTSSYEVPQLAAAVQAYHPQVKEFVLPFAPARSDIDGLLPQLADCEYVIAGTINAFSFPAQAEMIRALLNSGKKVIVVALRLPYDLAAFPEAPAYLCTYSLLEPSMHALAKGLFGKMPFNGKLPVSIPGCALLGFSAARN
jgi:Beta-glucosidase-related glycosidases